MTANYEYSRSYTDNVPLPVQKQLSEKLKIFFRFLIVFFESTLNFENFEKKKKKKRKNEPHSSSISEVIGSSRRVYLNG